MAEEFDVLDENGEKTGLKKHRKRVHQDGDWHRAVHVWIYVLETSELLIQKRALCKDSWPGLWDISAAGHVEAGGESMETACRETLEELGIDFPKETLEYLFTFKLSAISNQGAFIDNEFDDVYLVTVKQRIPLECFALQEDEVAEVRYVDFEELEAKYKRGDAEMAMSLQGDRAVYLRLFDVLRGRKLSGGLPGSGVVSFMHNKEGAPPTQIQALTFDETYLRLIPPEAR